MKEPDQQQSSTYKTLLIEDAESTYYNVTRPEAVNEETEYMNVHEATQVLFIPLLVLQEMFTV